MSASRRFAAALLAVALSAGLAGAAPRDRGRNPPPAAVDLGKQLLPDAALRTHLAAQRKLQIERLLAYQAAGKFPVNTTVPGMAHFFVDPSTGALCAMANLLAQSGHRDWVIEQSKLDNAIALGTVTSGRLYDWMLDSGLTVEEINFIQEEGAMVRRQIQRPGPATIPDELRPTALQENARIAAHLKLVVAQLTANTKQSLDTAVARAKAHFYRLNADPKGA